MITINNKEYTLKYTIKALFIYERITDKPFKFEGLYSEYLLFYCVLLANNEFNLSFDEFIDVCDDDPALFSTFREWLVKELNKQTLFKSEESEDTDDSKKKN